MKAQFLYPDSDSFVDASKLAYDLALIYAHAKCEETFLRVPPAQRLTDYPPMQLSEKEMLFLRDKFRQAYDFYMKAGPGSYELDDEEVL